MLPVPAELAREAHADIGDSYSVEVLGDAIIYHRVTGEVAFSGVGATRFATVPAGRPMRMPGLSSLPALNSWDF